MKKFIIICIVVALVAALAWAIIHENATHAPAAKPSATTGKKTPPPKKQPTSAVAAKLQKMSLRDKIASLFVLSMPGLDPQALGAFMDTYKAGGFIMMGDNIPGSDAALLRETAALRGADATFPRLVAVDQEGGTVRRLYGDNFANAETLKNLPVSATSAAFSARSAMVQSVGMTLNFGIIADTTADPNSFIYNRVLGTTPQAAADRVGAAVTATKGKTLSTLKHFPGHGETEADSHHTIPTTPLSFADWQKRDKPPFKAGIDAGADVVMTGHLRYSGVDSQPASLSKKWHDILRDQLGFNGVIITDAMGMLQDSGDQVFADPVKNAVAAIQAGNTMLLYVFDDTTRIDPNALIDGVTAAVQSGKISQSLIDESAQKALELREKSASLVTS